MRSDFYYGGLAATVASRIRKELNSRKGLLSPESVESPRAVGDTLQAVIAERFPHLAGDWCSGYPPEFGRRAMADFAFTDNQGVHSLVDVKTHREDAHFSMPNLTSARRLVKLYESDANVFALMIIRYRVQNFELRVSRILFVPIEFLGWSCLSVGALGWGQIQITNSNLVDVVEGYSRRSWMLELCDRLSVFYPQEIAKIQDRVAMFEDVRREWEAREDIWKF